MKRLLIFITLISSLFSLRLKGDEGMWLPHLIQSQSYEAMVRLGLKLTPEQIYDVNNSSLKDAIVRLGRGFCTGEMISREGLLLTNHHCGFSAIQKLSSTTDNYLKDGFWAMKRSEEKSAGFSVSFLVRIEDVTARMTEGLSESTPLSVRDSLIADRSDTIAKEVKNKDLHISGSVSSFFEGNKFYVFVYQTYPDVRFVGAPPASLGKYGGDTDNWMWPRHTADFSMFRVYADSSNNPVKYSLSNVPFKPKHHLPVSTKGVEKGDYAMIFGFPGSTDRYLTSHGIKYATEIDQPSRVKVRRAKLDIYEEYQAQSDAVRLQYVAKHAQVSNYWKYFIGQTQGLKRLHVYEQKKAQEDAFDTWANQNSSRKEEYGKVMSLYEKGYRQQNSYDLYSTYLREAVFGIESFAFAYGFTFLDEEFDAGTEKASIARYLSRAKSHFKNYFQPIDRKVCAQMLRYLSEDIDPSQQPAYFKKMVARYKGDFNKIADKMFKKSFLVNEEKTMAYLASPRQKKLHKDPVYKMFRSFLDNYYETIRPALRDANNSLAPARRLYVKGLIEMNPDHKYASDANSTMRMTYGQVLDYIPADAVFYKHYTTMNGVLEKYVPKDLEFDLPDRFIDLAKKKEYGAYADKDGELHVCFLSNNDITGGNSGSPVINGNGELIGIAFDGNWEAMSGDIAFEKELQRTISVDIRYTLWIIDVYAKAGHLVDEMTLVNE